jgi:hypothetical protein
MAITAARRAFSPAFSITQRDVVPSAELDAGRKPCAVWLARRPPSGDKPVDAVNERPGCRSLDPPDLARALCGIETRSACRFVT